MQWLTALIALGTGSLVALQMPIISNIGSRLGTLGSLFFVNATGLAGLVVLIAIRGHRFVPALQSLPWYAFLAGPMGLLVMGALSFAIPRIGVASALILSIVAQLAVGVLLDRLGYMNVAARTIDAWRIAGLVLAIAGALLVARK
jgi:transporter family-2 protein